MRYECANCRGIFRENEFVCHDWRNASQKFICPSCDAPLEKIPPEPVVISKQHFYKQLKKSSKVLVAIVVIKIILSYLNNLFQNNMVVQLGVPLIFVILVIVGIIVWIINNPPKPSKTNVYKKQI